MLSDVATLPGYRSAPAFTYRIISQASAHALHSGSPSSRVSAGSTPGVRFIQPREAQVRLANLGPRHAPSRKTHDNQEHEADLQARATQLASLHHRARRHGRRRRRQELSHHPVRPGAPPPPFAPAPIASYRPPRPHLSSRHTTCCCGRHLLARLSPLSASGSPGLLHPLLRPDHRGLLPQAGRGGCEGLAAADPRHRRSGGVPGDARRLDAQRRLLPPRLQRDLAALVRRARDLPHASAARQTRTTRCRW